MWKINNIDMTSFVQVGPSESATQDESLDTGLLVVSPLSNEDPINPGTDVLHVEGSETHSYKVVSDSVRLVSRAPLAYEHSVQFIQSTRYLSLFLLKGMDFQQPRLGGMQTFKCNSAYKRPKNGSDFEPWQRINADFNPPEKIYSKLKILKAKVSMSCYYFGNNNDFQVTSDINFVNGVDVCSVSSGVWTVLFSCPVHKTGESYYLTESQIQQIENANGSIALELPIPHTWYISPVPTLNYYSCANAVLEIESYYYTYLDVIQGIIDGSHRPSDSVTFEPPPCSLPISGEFFDFIDSTPAPDFQFTQGTSLYDALAEVYRAFDAVPTLESGVLGVEYMNERSIELQTGAVLQASSVSDEGRTSALICSYQNGVAKQTVTFPSETLFAKPRTADLGVPSSNKWYLPTPKPINRITHVWAKIGKIMLDLTESSTEEMTHVLFDTPIDDFVLEKSEWSLLDSNPGYTKWHPTQSNTFWYEKGKKGIYVGNIDSNVEGSTYAYGRVFRDAFNRFFGGNDSDDKRRIAWVLPGDDDWAGPWDIELRIEYIPEQDGVVRVEGYADKPYGSFVGGETLLNQSSGIVDLSKLGSSLLGLSCRNGEASKNIRMKLTSYADRPKKGQWVKYGNDFWVVQTAKTTQLKEGVYCDLELVKNFNQLSRKITLDREVSFVGIDPNRALKSETVYQEYVYFTTLAVDSLPKTPTHMSENMLLGVCLSPLDTAGQFVYSKPSFASFTGSTESFATEILYMPLMNYAAGNSLCFEGGFESPISAGNGLEAVADWFTYDLTSFANYYADSRGFCDLADIKICADGAVDSFEDLPVIDEPSPSLAQFQNLQIKKRPNDVFAFNYEIISLPYRTSDPDLMVYPKLFEESSLISNAKTISIRLFALHSGDLPYSFFESKAYGTEISASGLTFRQISSLGSSVLGWAKRFMLYSGASVFSFPSSCLGWMIADSEGNPLIASNQSNSAGNSIRFSAFSSHERL
jgi:hypothetical protein